MPPRTLNALRLRSRLRASLSLSLSLALCALGLNACDPQGTTTTPAEERAAAAPAKPSEQPTTSPATSASRPAEAAAIRDVADFKRAIAERFEGRVDASRGVVFIDIYDDEGEEQKPIAATRLCNEALDGRPARWADGLSARLQDSFYQDEQKLSCRGEHCWHEASEAGDLRGHYLFHRGVLQAVAFTSGPPGHIMSTYLEAEDAFVAEAVEALRDAPCGERYVGELKYEGC